MKAKSLFINFFKSQYNHNHTKRIGLSLGAVLGMYYVQNQYFMDTKTGKVNQQIYTWGYGNFGQLGLGSEVTKFIPQEVTALQNKKIKQISAKKMVTAILTEDGEVYTIGKNKGKILGSESVNTNVSLPMLVPGLENEKIEFITTGTLHMLAVTDKGEVYTWGNAQNGKLGHSYKEEDKVPSKRQINTRNYLDQGSNPQKLEGLPEGTKIIQGSCGNQFTVLLSDKGEIFTLGQNRKGVLGYQTQKEIQSIPQKLEFFNNKKVVQISSGFDFTLARTEDGKVYGWGNNDYGQLGNGSNVASEVPQQLIFGNDNIKTMSCGDYFAGAVNQNGEAFTWGYGGDGQLCQKSRENVFSPQKINFDQKIQTISCGGGHVAMITNPIKNRSSLYMFGRGREGQLGLGDTISSEATYRTEPKLVQFFKQNQSVVSAKCGGDHTIALVEQSL